MRLCTKGHLKVMAGFFTACLITSGCAGASESAALSTEEGTTVPPFVMPGTDVYEATQGWDSTKKEADSTEETESIPPVTVSIDSEPSSSETEPATEPVTSPSQESYTVVLDPGHGGTWVGALDGEYKEKNLALTTAIYCRQYLLDNYDGVNVYLTRETDMEFSYDQKKDLEERVRIASDYGADILVSLHFNSDPSDTSHGSLACVSKQPWVTNESAALANSILEQLSQLGLSNMGLLYRDSEDYFDEFGSPMDYYAICRHSASLGMPGIIVEHCFMRNTADKQFYTTEEALAALGRADAIGIASYLGLAQK